MIQNMNVPLQWVHDEVGEILAMILIRGIILAMLSL